MLKQQISLGVCLAAVVTMGHVSAIEAACGDGLFDAEELCVAGAINVLATTAPVRTVLAADVNADSFSDIVAITGDRSYIRLGSGAGPGAWTWRQYAGVNFRDVAAGDFDGDGDLDMAIADMANDRVIVRWNMGAPSFSVGMVVAVGDQPIRVLAARLNADARDDLAVLNVGSQSVTVLLAAGAGFAAANYVVGNTPDIALGDCNGDLWIDLLYVNGQGTATQLRARPNSNGFLAAALASAIPLFDPGLGYLTPLSIVSGDLDVDGVADANLSASHSRLAPATSNGDCTFTPQTLAWTWAWTFRQRTVDLDQNGSLDVAVPHGVGPQFSVAWGNNAGSFNPYAVEHLAAADAPIQDLAFGDFNGDGIRDVLVAANQGVLLLRGTP
jgi:hypothetical protein